MLSKVLADAGSGPATRVIGHCLELSLKFGGNLAPGVKFHPSNGEIREPAPQSRAPPRGWKVLEFGSSGCLLL